MSTSAAQASAFYRESLREDCVWTVRDDDGFPAPLGTDGGRAQPFWSLHRRAARVVDTVPAYADFQVVRIPLREFRERWLPGLDSDGIRVGLNWSGPRATGYDLRGHEVERNLTALDRATPPQQGPSS